MEVISRIIQSPLDEEIIDKYNLKQCLFFDIETTGFNKEINKIFAISIGKFEDGFYKTQVIFGEDEENILIEFLKVCGDKTYWCSFNGLAFDEPFLLKRLEILNIQSPNIENHNDFYRLITPYEKSLGLAGVSLKAIEKYLGINREDSISGETCKNLYLKFQETEEEDIKNQIILHNLEDVLYLPLLFQILEEIINRKLKKDNLVLRKQKKLIKHLIKSKGIKLDSINYEYLSKKNAARIIHELNQKDVNLNLINEIIKKIKK